MLVDRIIQRHLFRFSTDQPLYPFEISTTVASGPTLNQARPGEKIVNGQNGVVFGDLHYKIDGILGQGGMGVTYNAHLLNPSLSAPNEAVIKELITLVPEIFLLDDRSINIFIDTWRHDSRLKRSRDSEANQLKTYLRGIIKDDEYRKLMDDCISDHTSTTVESVTRAVYQFARTPKVKALKELLIQAEREFVREGAILKYLHYDGVIPHIPRTIGNVVRVENPDHTANFYFAQTRMQGRSLEQVMERQGALDENSACVVILQLLDILRLVHGKGVTHRDIKPSNILTHDDTGEIQVDAVDFGIAVPHSPRARELLKGVTSKVPIAGTPGFYAPEIMQGVSAPCVDVFSTGRLLFSLLVGKQDLEPNAQRFIRYQLRNAPERFVSPPMKKLIALATDPQYRARLTVDGFSKGLEEYTYALQHRARRRLFR